MMGQYGIAAVVALAVGLAGFGGVKWLRQDAVKDFMREAALVAAKKRAADGATLDQITEDINNATIDELRERAAAGGMFTGGADSAAP